MSRKRSNLEQDNISFFGELAKLAKGLGPYGIEFCAVFMGNTVWIIALIFNSMNLKLAIPISFFALIEIISALWIYALRKKTNMKKTIK